MCHPADCLQGSHRLLHWFDPGEGIARCVERPHWNVLGRGQPLAVGAPAVAGERGHKVESDAQRNGPWAAGKRSGQVGLASETQARFDKRGA